MKSIHILDLSDMDMKNIHIIISNIDMKMKVILKLFPS